VRALREHGQTSKNVHTLDGYTSRLDTIQAAVLLRKLPLLERWNEQRRRAARYYTDRLAGVGDLALPETVAGSRPVWHLYVIRTSNPNALAAFLRGRGVSTARHYPTPPHLSIAYSWLGHPRGSFPVAEALARESISLPLFPGITDVQQETVITAIEDFFHG
jgi:dTDP-4-amino-4,6-dideoxygalactose transaminase